MVQFGVTLLKEKFLSDSDEREIAKEMIDFYNNRLADFSLETWKDLYLIDNLFERLDDGYPKFFQEKFDYNKNLRRIHKIIPLVAW